MNTIGIGARCMYYAKWFYFRWGTALVLVLALYLALRYTLVHQGDGQRELAMRQETGVARIEAELAELRKGVASTRAQQRYFKVAIDTILVQQSQILTHLDSLVDSRDDSGD